MNKIVSHVFAAIFSLLSVNGASAAILAPSTEVRTVKTEHFAIHFPKELEPVIGDFAALAERIHTRMSAKLKWQPWGRTHVLLVDKTDQANGLATVIPSNSIMLFITPPESDSSLDHYLNYLELLFTHEYTHILHIDQHFRMADPLHWVLGKIVAPNGVTPGWMREGIAAWEETVETGRGRANSTYTDMIVRIGVLSNDFPAIDEAAGLTTRWPASDLQYLYGARFWRWLSEKYGEDSVQRYAEEYAGGIWLFSLNNKARRVFGKSFYDLWKEWKGELETHYRAVRGEIEREPITNFTPYVVHPEDQLAYATPRPGGGMAYVRRSNDEEAQVVIQAKDGEKPFALKRSTMGQVSFSRDGNLLAYSTPSTLKAYTYYNEVNVYDLKTKKTNRIAEGTKTSEPLRAMDPDFSPKEGGSRFVVLVRSDLGTDNLYLYDLTEKKGTPLTQAARYTQFSNPRFSPDGSRLVVSRKKPGGNRDLVLYSDSGAELAQLTDDAAEDNHPIWSADGNSIYYSSDKNGVPNIYRLDAASHAATRVTNVVYGVYQPALSADGSTLMVTSYSAKGADLARVSTDSLGGYPDASIPEAVALGGQNFFERFNFDLPSRTELSENSPAIPSKKYNAFPQVLVPRYLLPSFTTLDDSFLFGIGTGGSDPLYRHLWNLYADYRTDAQFVGLGANYTYARYNPSLFMGVVRYALDWGDLFRTGTNFFEERTQAYAGLSWFFKSHHNVSFAYFYENRDAFSSIPAGITPPILDQNAGVRVNYVYSQYKLFPDSISQENGPFLKIGLDITDQVLGSAEVNEQQVLTGDLRYYLEMPWADHHVLAIRAAAGWVWGDLEQIGGTFRFGGPFGEGALAGYSNRLFPFRGLPGVTFARDRVLLFSTEYRMPLIRVNRGIGTWPVFLKNVNLSLFSDAGDTWARNGKDDVGFFDDFLVSVGAELKGDFALFYGLPITGRMGYGIIVVNRDRIRGFGLTDSLFGLNAENGSFYLQFGTSF